MSASIGARSPCPSDPVWVRWTITDVLGDEDRAAEIEDGALEDYAPRRRIHPRHRSDTDSGSLVVARRLTATPRVSCGEETHGQAMLLAELLLATHDGTRLHR